MLNGERQLASDETVIVLYLADFSFLDVKLLADLERLAQENIFSPKIRVGDYSNLPPNEYWEYRRNSTFPVTTDPCPPLLFYYKQGELTCIESGWQARRLLERVLGIERFPY
jgi:hypothetical protein